MMDRKNRNIILLFLAMLLIVLLPGGSPASSTGPGITPEKAYELLKKGNDRYVNNRRVYGNLGHARMLDTAKNGQHPYATIIGCSDSRVPIEHLFDVGIGDTFIIRVAGNVCDIDEAGSIEYGVDHLGTPVLVILGHTGCGAVTAVTRGDEVHGNIPRLVDNIIPAVKLAKEKHGNTFGPELLEAAIKYNVWNSIEELLRRSPVTAGRVENGKLQIIGAVYHLDSGKVEWMGKHPEEKALLTEYSSSHGDGHGSSIAGLIGNAGKKSAGLAFIILIVLTVNYILFFMEKTRIKSVKIKGRILAGFLSIIAVFLISLLSLVAGGDTGELNIRGTVIGVLAAAGILSIVFSLMFLNSIIGSFKKVINALKSGGSD